MMKKEKRAPAIQRDDKRPTKAAAPPPGKRLRPNADYVEVPSYEGPKKTDRMPSGKNRQPGATKPALKTDTKRRPPAYSGDIELGDQIAQPSRGTTANGREQYIRLRIRVHNDRMTVIDTHLVDGPLSQTQTFSGMNAYEITVGDLLLHAGALPDIGVQRSFVN